MGIQGLLPFLKKASRPANIKEFKGCTVAIDSYCWLHRGAFACAEKLAVGEKTEQYVFYCMKYVNNLLSMGIKPIMVFDGCHLPSKKEVEKTRRERRDVNRKKAAQLLREGKRGEARDALTKCIDITAQMALDLMNACRSKGVDCIVAPYEADAQLAYLSRTGIAQVIITEDSDLILFGCEKVIFKMDVSGNGILIEKENLNVAIGMKADLFTFTKFRHMCILSGCDYLASLPGIGLGKACKFVKLTRTLDITQMLRKMPATLNMPTLSVSADYVEGFVRANNTFLYQLIYDPRSRHLGPLNPYPSEINTTDLKYAGPPLSAEKAMQIALGNIDINSGQHIADFDPDNFKPKTQCWEVYGRAARDMLHLRSIWDPSYRPMPRISQHGRSAAAHVDQVSTLGKEVSVAVQKLRKKSPVKRKSPEKEEDNTAEILSGYAFGNKNPGLPAAKKLKMYHHEEDTESKENEFEDDGMTDDMEFVADSVVPCSSRVVKEPVSPAKPLVASPPDVKKKLSNVFAFGSDSARKKFSLNATKSPEDIKPSKKVLSRFFKSKRPLQATSFYEELKKEHDVLMSPTKNPHVKKSDTDSEEEDFENHVVTPKLEVKRENQSSISQTLHDAKNSSNNCTPSSPKERLEKLFESGDSSRSPYASFGFSKLDKFKSKFVSSDSSSTDLPQSQTCKKPFTPVTPSNSVKLLKLKSVSDSNMKCDSQVSTLSGSLTDYSEKGSGTVSEARDCSSYSNLYSIDSSCLLFENPSQTNADLSDSGPSTASVKPEKSDERPSTPLLPMLPTEIEKSTKSLATPLSSNTPSRKTGNQTNIAGSAGGSTRRGGVRASGLSRPQGSAVRAQPNITNFFSGFKFNKKSEKVPSQCKVLSPSKANIDSSH